jgi:hypothetical protein
MHLMYLLRDHDKVNHSALLKCFIGLLYIINSDKKHNFMFYISSIFNACISLLSLSSSYYLAEYIKVIACHQNKV